MARTRTATREVNSPRMGPRHRSALDEKGVDSWGKSPLNFRYQKFLGNGGVMEFDLGRELGADEGYSSQRLTLYIPNKDKAGKKVANLKKWIDEARKLLSHIGGGATAYPPADGNWVDEKGENL